MGCCGNVCDKCYGGKILVTGLVILATAVYWRGYIWHVIGALIALKGIAVLAMPQGCGHCDTMPVKKKKK